jgi:hypothetical protein
LGLGRRRSNRSERNGQHPKKDFLEQKRGKQNRSIKIRITPPTTDYLFTVSPPVGGISHCSLHSFVDGARGAPDLSTWNAEKYAEVFVLAVQQAKVTYRSEWNDSRIGAN